MVIQIKQINDDVVVIETYKNKCKFCDRLIGDGVSNYHIGCYKQKNLLDEKEAQDKKEVLQDE